MDEAGDTSVAATGREEANPTVIETSVKGWAAIPDDALLVDTVARTEVDVALIRATACRTVEERVLVMVMAGRDKPDTMEVEALVDEVDGRRVSTF